MSSAAAVPFSQMDETKRGTKLRLVEGGATGRTTVIVRSGGTTAITYDFESQMISTTKPGMTTNSYSNNGLDTRVWVTDSRGSRSFKRNGIGVTAPVLSDGLANYTPSGEVRGGVKTTFHSALKNADIQTNSSNAVSASVQFDAFGNDLSVSGSWKSPIAYAGQFGYQQHVDTGLKLLGHRYYDSDTGRFLTRDPIKDGGNWYGYCGNNPVSRSDPAGLFAFEADDAWYTRVVGFGDGIIDLAFSLDVTSAAIDLLLQKPPASVRIRQLLKTTDQVDMSVADYRIANVAGQVFGGIVLGKLQSVAQVQFRTYPHSGGGGAKIFSYGVDTKWRFDVHAWKAGVQQQPFYKWPHYHRPPRKGLGGTPGEGRGRHRPWQGW